MQFARTLDDVRKTIPPAVRAAIRRLNPSDPEAEMSLRAFYALSPPAEDPALADIASYLGARLTPDVTDDPEPPDDGPSPAPDETAPSADEIDRWANGEVRLSANSPPHPAVDLRRGGRSAQSGPYGLVINGRSKATVIEWQIGSYTLRTIDVEIERADGGGSIDRPHPFRITATDENAVMVRGILAAVDGNSLDSEDQGRWFFDLQTRISDYAGTIAQSRSGRRRGSPTRCHARAGDPAPYRCGPGPVGPRCPGGHAGAAPPQPERDHQGLPPRRAAHPGRSAHARAGPRHHGQGHGKPSLLDVGPVLRQLQSEPDRAIGRSSRPKPRRPDAQAPPGQQAQAAERAWAVVGQAVQAVGQVLRPHRGPRRHVQGRRPTHQGGQ